MTSTNDEGICNEGVSASNKTFRLQKQSQHHFLSLLLQTSADFICLGIFSLPSCVLQSLTPILFFFSDLMTFKKMDSPDSIAHVVHLMFYWKIAPMRGTHFQ
jgi:hypothetical protein